MGEKSRLIFRITLWRPWLLVLRTHLENYQNPRSARRYTKEKEPKPLCFLVFFVDSSSGLLDFSEFSNGL